MPSTSSAADVSICYHCREKKQKLTHVFPTKDVKLLFCSEHCLILHRRTQKAKFGGNVASALAHNKESKPMDAPMKSPSLVSPKAADRQANDGEDSDVEFNWNDYLADTGSKAAPAHCFKQSSTPPKNEFALSSKLEALDPRSQSMCIASVVGASGSRVRLRLDGSDANNDFWKMVDSADLHEVGHCQKTGGMLQPPVGFTLSPTSWPKFLQKTLDTCGDKFAPLVAFKPEPAAPKRNFFEVGQKLEAIDRKNPHLICCATIGEVKGEHEQHTGFIVP